MDRDRRAMIVRTEDVANGPLIRPEHKIGVVRIRIVGVSWGCRDPVVPVCEGWNWGHPGQLPLLDLLAQQDSKAAHCAERQRQQRGLTQRGDGG